MYSAVLAEKKISIMLRAGYLVAYCYQQILKKKPLKNQVESVLMLLTLILPTTLYSIYYLLRLYKNIQTC